MFRTLRSRFLAAAFVATAVAVAGSLALAGYWCYRSVRSAQEDAHLALASSVGEQLAGWLLEKAAVLQAVSVGELWPIARGEETRPLPIDFLKKNGVRSLRLFRRDGRTFQEVRLAPSFPPTGVAATETAQRLEEAVAKGLAAWTTRTGQELQLLVAVPVPEAIGGGVDLCLVGEIDATSMLRRLFAESRYRIVLLRDGGRTPILTAAEHGLVLEPLESLPPPLERWAAERRPATAPANSESTALAPEPSSLGMYERAGAQWLGAAVPLRAGDLVLYSEFPESTVTDSLRSYAFFAFPVGFLAVTGALFVLLLGTGGIRRGFVAVENALGAAEKGQTFVGANVAVPFQELLRKIATVLEARRHSEHALRAELDRYRFDANNAGRVAEEARVSADRGSDLEKKIARLQTTWEENQGTVDEMKTPIAALQGRLERTTQLVEATSRTPSHEGEPHSMPSELSSILAEWEGQRRNGSAEQFAQWLCLPSEDRARGRVDDDLPALRQLAEYWQRETRILLSDLRFFRDQTEHLGRLAQRLEAATREMKKS